MTREEKSKAIDDWCAETNCDKCPLDAIVNGRDECCSMEMESEKIHCDIDRNYDILVKSGLIAPDDEIETADDKVDEAHKRFMSIGEIKDSGNRREFDTGAVRDMAEGKGRCDLMPLDVVADIMKNPIIRDIAQYQETKDVKTLERAVIDFAYICEISLAELFLEVSKHFEEGAKKYGENNWQKGLPVNCYIDSALRHYLKWLRGDKDEPHDRAFVWNILCCVWTVKHIEGCQNGQE